MLQHLEMRLYRVVYDEWENPATHDKTADDAWEEDKERYVIAPAASEVAKKYEERDDTRFHSIELVSDEIDEIEH